MCRSKPTHGAVPLEVIGALLKFFKETPLPHAVSDPFVRALSNLPLLNLDSLQAEQESSRRSTDPASLGK